MQHHEHILDRLRHLRDKVWSDHPEYPNLGQTVAKLRRKAADACIVHRKVLQREHGRAVLEAVRKLARSSLQRELPEHKVDCPSRTNHNCGKAILKAIREQAKRTCDPDRIRAARPIDAIIKAYEAAMVAKRKCEAIA